MLDFNGVLCGYKFACLRFTGIGITIERTNAHRFTSQSFKHFLEQMKYKFFEFGLGVVIGKGRAL
jgi:hypothetical protein